MVHGSQKEISLRLLVSPKTYPPEKNSKESHTKIEGGAAEARCFVQMITKGGGTKKKIIIGASFMFVYFGKP